jgi:hypothetical protein
MSKLILCTRPLNTTSVLFSPRTFVQHEIVRHNASDFFLCVPKGVFFVFNEIVYTTNHIWLDVDRRYSLLVLLFCFLPCGLKFTVFLERISFS